MSDRPNIIVVMTDQQRATASHLYGNTFCHTPAMQRLAEAEVLRRMSDLLLTSFRRKKVCCRQ